MTQPTLVPTVTVLTDALRALEGALSGSRGQWNDQARQGFDKQHTDPIIAEARQAVRELNQLAQDLAAATRLLAD